MKKSPLDGIVDFEWDKGNLSHIKIHNVNSEEAEDLYFDLNNTLREDLGHSISEKRFIIIGKTQKGRLLYQVFTIRIDKIRVISSRDINKKEVRLYEKKVSRTKV